MHHRQSLLLLVASTAATARFLHSLPEDTYAFPKFRVNFLNESPLLNQTAERWLAEGLQGGQSEFLGTWSDNTWPGHSSLKEIGSGSNESGTSADPKPPYSLEVMKMGPDDTYLCLIPKSLDPPQMPPEDEDSELTPTRSWALLQPLSGTCLYHRQGWFTYSYCHNKEIRQFKELAQAHSHVGYKPEEDPEWEAYTLGKAPVAPEPGTDLTVAQQNAQAANLELARNAGSRYLVQRWGDGTICDKTGKHREVEVQFHCSMAMTDNILFVKEAKTCSYVLVIHTPRLCGEPGFKSRRDAEEEALIQCREVVPSLDNQQQGGRPATPSEADHPGFIARKKRIAPHPIPAAKTEKSNIGSTSDTLKSAQDKVYSDLLRKALEAIVKKGDVDEGKTILEDLSEEGIVVQFLDDTSTEESDDGHGAGTTRQGSEQANRIIDALKAAGFDVKVPRGTQNSNGNSEGNKRSGKEDTKRKQNRKNLRGTMHRDEL
ncbi:hypothetical protein AX16_003715 [Volvariella volvacea WC 439]|nr:hypothetical protein AX16_003715 [Volvariella volvacea WC 439]